MANTKISALSDGGNAQATDEFAVARSGANYRIDGASIAAAATSVGTLTSLTVSGNTYVATTSGALGVGTTSPSAAGSNYGAIDVRGTAGGGIRYGISAGFNMLTYATGTSADFVTSAAGDVRFFNKTSTGEALRITSTGDLIVGNGDTNGSPSPQTIRGTNGLGTNTAGAALTIQGGRGTGSGAGGAILFSTSAAGASGTTLRTATERARIDSSGNLLVGTTTTTANGGVVQVSNGVTFPATQSACSDANTLDDYEEGTFTPAFVNGTFTYSNRAGRYIKIGKMVTVSGCIGWTAASGSGGVEFTSPFTAVTDADYRFTGALGFTSGVTITGVTATWAGESNSARIALRNVNSNASPTAIVVADLAASGQLQFTVTYETA